MKSLIPLLIIFLFSSCNKIDHEFIKEKEAAIIASSKSDSMPIVLFRTLKSGMRFDQAERIINNNPYFRFDNNKEIKSVSLHISGDYHNDSLIRIRLWNYDFKKHPFLLETFYNNVVKEFEKKYDTPDLTATNEAHWFIKNKHISILSEEGVFRLNYEDEYRKSKFKLTKSKFDEYGNSFDPDYFELKKRAKEIIEENNINSDI